MVDTITTELDRQQAQTLKTAGQELETPETPTVDKVADNRGELPQEQNGYEKVPDGEGFYNTAKQGFYVTGDGHVFRKRGGAEMREDQHDVSRKNLAEADFGDEIYGNLVKDREAEQTIAGPDEYNPHDLKRALDQSGLNIEYDSENDVVSYGGRPNDGDAL